jgi:hypothetical protein
MNLMVQVPRHSSSIDFCVKTTNVKASLHLHVEKIQIQCISIFLITFYFEWLFVTEIEIMALLQFMVFFIGFSNLKNTQK